MSRVLMRGGAVRVEFVSSSNVVVVVTRVTLSSLVVERRRRFNINDRIKELGMMLPKSFVQ